MPKERQAMGDSITAIGAKPFVKWAGGKRQLAAKLLAHVPAKIGTYYEPFVGGGALFFALDGRFEHALLNDANKRLIETYAGVRDDVETVISLLKTMPYLKTFYIATRKRDPDIMAEVDVAAWFIYLNKAGFNGLYRVNSSGGFNVPFGRYTNPTICDEPGLRAAAEALAGVQLRDGDFEKAVKSAERGDFVYFDPPYWPASPTSNFTGYTAGGFGAADHQRLRDIALVLKKRGVGVMLSNADLPPVRALYGKGFELERVEARRGINSDAGKRGPVGELIIT